MKTIIKTSTTLFLLFIALAVFAKNENKAAIDSLKKEFTKLQEENQHLKENVDSYKQDALDKILKEYIVTNDRVNSYVTLVSVIATMFGIIIALTGIWITYLSYRTQTKSEAALKIIENAKGYADDKRRELDELVKKTTDDLLADYEKTKKLITDETLSNIDFALNDLNRAVKNVKEVSEQKAQEIEVISNSAVKNVKEVSEQKAQEIQSIDIQQEKNEDIERVTKRIQFLENLGLTDDPKVLFSKAKLLHEEKKYDEVIAILQKVISKDPKNGEAHWYLAHALTTKEKFELAIENYKRSIDLGAMIPGAYNNLGVIYDHYLNKLEEGLKMYDEAIKAAPTYFLSIRNKGKVLTKLNRDDEAIESYDKAIEINPKDSETFDLILSIYKRRNNQQKVIATFDKAITNMAPDNHLFNFNKATYLLEIKHYEDSIAIFQNLIAQNQFVPGCKRQLALIKTAQEKFDEVDEILESLVIMNPKDNTTYYIATDVLIKQGSQKVAIFIRKYKANISNKDTLQYIARIIANSNNIELALEFYKDAMELLIPKIKEHEEGSILDYFEGLLLLNKLNDATNFYEENKKFILSESYKSIERFLLLSLLRLKNEIDDTTFITEISKINSPEKPKWIFEDLNNYLRPILSTSAYDKMIETQTRLKK